MAHTIIERPIEFCFSKNELRYVYNVTALNRAGLYLEIKLQYQLNGSSIVSFPEFRLKPNSDGMVYFYFQQYIDSLLTYNIPSPGAAVTNASNQWCKFWVHTREIEDANLTPAYNTHEDTKPRVAFKAGVEQHKYSRNNWFNHFTNTKMWLSWRPDNSFVFPNQPVYLSVLLTSGLLVNHKLQFTISDVNNTTSIVTINLANAEGYIFHFDVNHLVFSMPNPIGTLYKYSVQLLDGSNAAITEDKTFYLNYDYVIEPHDFIYINSLSGLDFARVRGEVTNSIEKLGEEADGGFSYNNWSNDVQQYSTVNIGQATQRIYKGDIGFLDTKAEQESYLEILNSRNIYENVNDRYIALSHIGKSLNYRQKSDTKLSFPIEWKLQEVNESFTPSSINLGLGADTETYP